MARDPDQFVPAGYDPFKVNQFTRGQRKLFGGLFENVTPGSYLDRVARGDQEIYGEIEKPQLRGFTGELGQIASEFSGQGMGARRSSGFQNATNKAAADFAQKMMQNRQNIRRDAMKNIFEMSNMLLGQRPAERGLASPEDEIDPWMKAAGSAIGTIWGAAVGQPYAGYQIGSEVGNYWGGL